MDENINLNVDAGVEQVNTDTTTNNNNIDNEMVTMTKADFTKAIQGEGDKIRKEYSLKNKELQNKLNELTPIQKTQKEIDLENRLLEIENKQREVENKEKDLALRAALQEANLDKSIADFVKTDIDVKAFATVISSMVTAGITAQGYVPSNHTNNTGITKEQLKAMTYSEAEALIEKNPHLIDLLK